MGVEDSILPLVAGILPALYIKENTMSVILVMFLMHFLADFPLQGPFLANNKAKSKYLLLVHSFIWAMLVCIPLVTIGTYKTWMLVFLFVTHILIDYWKCTTFRDEFSVRRVLGISISGRQAFLIDQLLHAGTILIVVAFM